MMKGWMARVGVVGVGLALGCGDSGTATSDGSTSVAPPLTTSGEQTTSGEPVTTGEPETTDTPTSTGSMSGTTTGEPETTGGVSATTTATTTGTGPECEAPTVACGDECVDTQADTAHCGGCDMPCAAEELCEAGSCMLACPEGQVMCGDECVDTQANPDHCGGCDAPCMDGELCNMGVCALECDPGLEECTGACVDTQTDEAHCGGCDMPCEGCQECGDGTCALPAAGPAPGMIMGAAMVCANSSGPYSIAAIDGAVKYTWTVPEGSMVTAGQDTEAVTIKFGANNGQVCVTYNDGCVDSLPSCVDVTITGGAPGSQVFSFTGAAQEFVLPACVSAVTVELFGAQGGGAKCCDNSIQDDGGKGGYVKALLTGNPGDKWGVYVGGKGATEGGAGWNGGAAGGQWGAGGGGSSDVRIGGAALANRALVAGGGGGGNCGCPEHGAGGDGGALVGDAGSNGGGGFTPGGGGTQNAGGAGGSAPGAAGALGLGGGPADYHVGGGGGGFYGGGGAYAAGGGGGSSYFGNAMNASTTKGQRVGNGEIKFSW